MTLTVDETPFGFDPLNPGFRADPYSVYRRQRETDPVHHSPMSIWTLTRHADCEAALRDQKLGHGDGINGSDHLSFLTLNPPDHTRLRGLVSRAFTPKVIRELRPRIEQRVTELLAPLRDGGEFDLISGFAYPLPVMVISELIGVPAPDREHVRHLIDTIFHIEPGVGMINHVSLSAQIDLRAYFLSQLAEVRAHPRDDMLTGLVGAEIVDDSGVTRRLNDEESADFANLLVSAGTETVARLLGWAAVVLAAHPAERAALVADPSLIPNAVEELLRFEAPSPVQARWTTRPVELHGEVIPENSKVVLITGAAGRDRAAFPDPDRFDVRRTFDHHLSFGYGIHFCLGAALARLEGQLALAGLATALPALELVDEQPAYRDHFILRGVSALHVRA